MLTIITENTVFGDLFTRVHNFADSKMPNKSGPENLIKNFFILLYLIININIKTIEGKTQIVPYTKCKRNPKLTLIFEPKSRQMNPNEPNGTQMDANEPKTPPLPKSTPFRVPFGVILGSIWDT